MSATKTALCGTRQPYHRAQVVAPCSKKYDSIRANISGTEVYRHVRMKSRKLRREFDALPLALQDTVHTCRSCAVRSKCSAFNEYRTTSCSSKIEPLPPVKL